MTAFRSPLSIDANAGRVALVTGGGTGIGRATARELARTGAKIAICGRREEPLESVRVDLEASGAECLAVPADLRESEQAAHVVEETLERFGRIDLLVHCAGGQFEAPAEEISPKGWRAVHRLVVDAAWDLTRTVAERSMIPNQEGLIVFIGFSPRRGIPLNAHASAARAALENLAEGLAIEWSRFGLRAVCVACGNIDTDAYRAYGKEAIERAERETPLGRLGTPEEVASVIAFLASAGGGFVTGTTIVVDGGANAWGLAALPPEREPR